MLYLVRLCTKLYVVADGLHSVVLKSCCCSRKCCLIMFYQTVSVVLSPVVLFRTGLETESEHCEKTDNMVCNATLSVFWTFVKRWDTTCLAQLVEKRTVNPGVSGSIPSQGGKNSSVTV